jgi:hypothetical protein
MLVIVDSPTKYSNFMPLKHPYTARAIAEIFVKEVVRLHGVPSMVVSDRDPIFMSMFWREFFKFQGSTLKMSTSYHPRTDGQTEVIIRCLETYLRCFIADQPKGWSQWLALAEYWYNTTFHESIRTTPFEAFYGRKPPVVIKCVPGEVKMGAVQRELLDRDEALRQLKSHLIRAQARMKSQADKNRQECSFHVGEKGFLDVQTSQTTFGHGSHQSKALNAL